MTLILSIWNLRQNREYSVHESIQSHSLGVGCGPQPIHEGRKGARTPSSASFCPLSHAGSHFQEKTTRGRGRPRSFMNGPVAGDLRKAKVPRLRKLAYSG